MRYSYLSEKLSAASRNLLLPHPNGEAESIMHAFHECSLGLRYIDRESLDETPREWIRKLEALMNTDGLLDPTGKGLWRIKAERLTVDEKFELSHVVSELVYWFSHVES